MAAVRGGGGGIEQGNYRKTHHVDAPYPCGNNLGEVIIKYTLLLHNDRYLDR